MTDKVCRVCGLGNDAWLRCFRPDCTDGRMLVKKPKTKWAPESMGAPWGEPRRKTPTLDDYDGMTDE